MARPEDGTQEYKYFNLKFEKSQHYTLSIDSNNSNCIVFPRHFLTKHIFYSQYIRPEQETLHVLRHLLGRAKNWTKLISGTKRDRTTVVCNSSFRLIADSSPTLAWSTLTTAGLGVEQGEGTSFLSCLCTASCPTRSNTVLCIYLFSFCPFFSILGCHWSTSHYTTL
jgi:hypothetical protein